MEKFHKTTVSEVRGTLFNLCHVLIHLDYKLSKQCNICQFPLPPFYGAGQHDKVEGARGVSLAIFFTKLEAKLNSGSDFRI